MALDQSALLEVLEALKAADVDDRIRSAATTIYQALIEAELTAVIGAGPHERTDARTAQRNGSRPRTLSTTAGDLELRIPKLRAGSFFPCLLERRRRIDQALFAVVMEAYLHGVSTRKVDDLVRALGADTGPHRHVQRVRQAVTIDRTSGCEERLRRDLSPVQRKRVREHQRAAVEGAVDRVQAQDGQNRWAVGAHTCGFFSHGSHGRTVTAAAVEARPLLVNKHSSGTRAHQVNSRLESPGAGIAALTASVPRASLRLFVVTEIRQMLVQLGTGVVVHRSLV